MNVCAWERISAFRSLNEFDRFVEWMAVQTTCGTAEEVPVEKTYLGGNTFREKWFRHIASGHVWRLVWPDASFKGVFEPAPQ
jgi:hypothetical protein